MAHATPLTPGSLSNIVLPAPPPALYTKSINEADRPRTPTQQNGFTSPLQTPQGSPSKNRQPPGAHNLPDVFENAMKLQPTPFSSPNKGSKHGNSSTPNSPKGVINIAEDNYFGIDSSILRADTKVAPGSPLRQSMKENTPPGARLTKGVSTPQSPAGATRADYYSPSEQVSATRKFVDAQARLSKEDLEKLQKPNVKRLANVAQLCKCIMALCMGDIKANIGVT